MRFVGRSRARILLVAALCLARSRVGAQEISGPVVLIEPGMLTSDFLSAASGQSSTTGFNFRFLAILRTSRGWLTPVLGASVTPFGTTGYGQRSSNAPILFIGNVFPLMPERMTGGWLRVELPILWYYSYGGGGPHNNQLYGRDLYAELAVIVPIGNRLLRELGTSWSRVDLYGRLDQNLTPNFRFSNGRVDRFNPIALYGVSIRFGPTAPHS